MIGGMNNHAADPYANIPELYDLEHADFRDDIELYLELADIGEGPILELGCGSGRVLIPLAEEGHDVVGIDASEPMLDRARGAMGDLAIPLIHGDMSDPASVPGGPFGTILVSINSIMHLSNSTVQREMLASARSTLKPGGRLIIDTLNPSVGQLNHLLNTTHHEGSWRLEDGTAVDKWGHRSTGDEPQVINTLIWYDLTSSDGSFRRVRTGFDLRYVHQSELALMLELAGFHHTDWYGSYELDSWDPDSERIIAISHKDH